VSDHGFASFRRGINLNAWLLREGYLHLRPGRRGNGRWHADVDWSRTRAYAFGICGLYLNLRGREQAGIVEPGAEANALKAELRTRLVNFRDEADQEVAILPAYARGYRISWDGAAGVAAGSVFEDNVKPWSGDHAVDPRLVPGVFFCNRPVKEAAPSLLDLAPTALDLFGVAAPSTPVQARTPKSSCLVSTASTMR
jgi:predicted AlkP superfamily phosphohydrolase/phosphomutase